MDDLEHREGLPSALRVLFEEYPRESWEAHENFSGLIRFWLDRHLMFRKLLTSISSVSEATSMSKMDPHQASMRLRRFGGIFVNELHSHHPQQRHLRRLLPIPKVELDHEHVGRHGPYSPACCGCRPPRG